MSAVDDPWAPITPAEARAILADLTIRWWVAGGWALDLPAGRATRSHQDLDIAILRTEHERLRDELATWDLRIAFGGRLRPWRGGPVGPPENTVWGRPEPDQPWLLDFKIELVENGDWVYRRDPGIRFPVDSIGRKTADGIPYLRSEIAALYSRL